MSAQVDWADLSSAADNMLSVKLDSANSAFQSVLASVKLMIPQHFAEIAVVLTSTVLKASDPSELEFIALWDSLVAGPWRLLSEHTTFKMSPTHRRVRRAFSHTLMAGQDEVKTGVPDLLLIAQVDNTPIVRAEERKHPCMFRDAVSELTEKMRPLSSGRTINQQWSYVWYGRLPFIFAYAAAGPIFQWFAIGPDFSMVELSRRYDLHHKDDRHEVMCGAVAVFKMACGMASLMPPCYRRLRVYVENSLPSGNFITLFDSYVIKRSKLHENRMHVLRPLLELLQKDAIPHCMHVLNIQRVDKLFVNIFYDPVGMDALEVIANEEELKTCVHNVLLCLSSLHELGWVHRDIRWPNILRRRVFFLIDFEMADCDGASVRTPFNVYCPPGSAARAWTHADDLWQVGNLLNTGFRFTLSDTATKFKDDMQNGVVKSVNAALVHPWFNRKTSPIIDCGCACAGQCGRLSGDTCSRDPKLCKLCCLAIGGCDDRHHRPLYRY